MSAAKNAADAAALAAGLEDLAGRLAYAETALASPLAGVQEKKELMKDIAGRESRALRLAGFMARLKTENLELTYELTGIFPKASYAHAELLGDKLIEQHKLHNFESVTIIGNEFKSMLAQEPRETEIIPLMAYGKFGRTDIPASAVGIDHADPKRNLVVLIQHYRRLVGRNGTGRGKSNKKHSGKKSHSHPSFFGPSRAG